MYGLRFFYVKAYEADLFLKATQIVLLIFLHCATLPSITCSNSAYYCSSEICVPPIKVITLAFKVILVVT